METELSVRLASPEDANSILECLRMMHDENGLFSLSGDRVREIISNALSPPPGMIVPPMVGVIGRRGEVEATICVMLNKLWYTDEWHLGDLWNYIRQDCRKKNHIAGLLEFAKSCSDKVDVPLMMGVVSNKRTEAKVRIYSRHFGVPLGAFFIYRPKKEAA